MYFISGGARILSAPNPHSQAEDAQEADQLSSTVIALRKCPEYDYFATITANSIHLWSIRPNAVLSCVRRADLNLKENGTNSDIIWKRNASGLVVITSNGFLHFYDVITVADTLLNYEFHANHHYVRGPGEAGGVPAKALRFRSALEISAGVQCGVGLDRELIVCTRESPSLLSLSWNGEIQENDSVILSSLDFHVEDSQGIIQIIKNPHQSIFGWITTTGCAVVAQRKEQPFEDGALWTGVCIYNPENGLTNATSIAFNSRFSLVSVGTTDGTIHVYSINDEQLNLRVSHKLQLPKSVVAYLNHSTGDVTALEWTSDGYALAVGWKSGGLALWSVFGRMLASTISEDTTIQTPSDGSAALREEYFDGVQDLFWGTGDFDLYVLPGPGPLSTSRNNIYVMPLLKTPLVACGTLENSRSVFLIGEDRLLLYEGNNSEFNVTDLDLIQWDTIQIPYSYIASNWPIRFASINSTGRYLAVAGIYGLAHYNIATNRWKLFGNEQQERSFSVRGGMLWWENILLVGCANVDIGDFELRLFSRDANLGLSQALLHQVIIQEPVAMSSLDSQFLVYGVDNAVRLYSIVNSDSGKPSLNLQQQISFVDIILNPWTVQSITCIPSFGDKALESIKSSPFLLLRAGELNLLRATQEKTWECILLAENIEHVFVSNQVEKAAGMHHSIWAFDGSGVKIWTNTIVDDHAQSPPWTPAVAWQEDFKLELEFYPLTVMMHRAIIMGIEQRILLKNSVQCIFYKLETKTHLYLHTIIRNVLSRGMAQEAVAFAAGFRHLQYFGHSLEMLLHQVLEEEAEKFAGFSKGGLLPSIARFLEAFPHRLDVIVRCARKTEVALWEYFFSIVGDAKELFSQCLESGALDTATSYLIIIQTLEPASVSSKLAVQLLERAFELEDFQTGRELIRFLSNINEGIQLYNSPISGVVKNHGMSVDKKNLEGHIRSIPLTDGTDLLYIEALICKHARALMSKQRIRVLVRFARHLSFPLIAWLKKERNRSAMVEDWYSALMSLHEQFERPLPSEVNASSPRMPSSSRKPSFFSFLNSPPSSSMPILFEGGSRFASPSLHSSRLISAYPQIESQPHSNHNYYDTFKTSDGSKRSVSTKTSSQISNLRSDSLGVDLNEEEELMSMVEATREAECWEWCLLLASFAMDVSMLLEALSEDEGPAAGLLNKWKNTLITTNCRGYRQLVNIVESKLLSPSTGLH